MADNKLKEVEEQIDKEYEKEEKVSLKTYCKIVEKCAEYIYLKTYDELQSNERYIEIYTLLWRLMDQFKGRTNEKIISIVDPDSRVAHKSPGVRKKGYKNHILIDEDSEIILSSITTPFNVGDQKELIPLIEKTDEVFNLKPEEISADKVYGTTYNRSY